MNKIYAVGIGPGSYEQMTIQAIKVLKDCDMIVGYTVYIELVKEFLKEKEFFSTPMTKEKERCIFALEEASKGKKVAMVCSGDAGVYGMAGLLLEIGQNYKEVEIEVVAGITAALSGAALLGAPLMHDFVCISLSDLLTPWEKIEKRLEYAAKADFVICLYNPSSKKRRDYLEKACNILLQYLKEDIICGIVSYIGRQGEKKEILTLKELKKREVNMFTTIFIGNSQTKKIKENIITPRGYSC